MRDPARIDRIIEKLRAVWRESPDLRLGQLVSWAMAYEQVTRYDVFSVEDDVTERGLDGILADKETP